MRRGTFLAAALVSYALALCAVIALVRATDPSPRQVAWQKALDCSGLTPQPGGDLGDVVWRTFPESSFASAFYYGVWAPPDTIYMDPVYQDTVWALEHELLHHLLRGAVHGDHHPPVFRKCGVATKGQVDSEWRHR